MHYHIDRQEAFSLGSIEATDEGVVLAHLSVDTHTDNSVLEQALHYMYPDALLSGAGSYSREKFLHEVNMLGASINTSISNGILQITLRSTSVVFPKLLKLVEVMLTKPTFATSELARIRTTTANELHIKQENSSALAHEAMRNAMYSTTDRRFSASPQVLTSTLQKVTQKDLQRFHESVLAASWTCSIAGTKENISDLSKLVRKLKKGEATLITSAHKQKATTNKVLLTNIPSRSNIDFSIGVPIPITIHHPDYLPLMFGLGVLSIPGFAGRLMNTVRDKEGLTYGIYGYLESFSGTEQGYARIVTFFNPPQTIQGITSTFREIKKIYESGITAAEFDRFQTIFTTKQSLLQDSLLRQLADLHSYNVHGFTVDEIAAHKAKLANITRKEVNDAIKKYLDPTRFIISGAGPTKASEKDLRKFVSTLTKG
ncbi:MAG: insulinase family protein [Candidatus Kaiserbacteria bacterium]|nr:insulinase family protein [Candidatus Kaiserbacteria bacterium]MCB9816008.1 insulinase family protein [Candidatus Nomurabacteria bacterium]